MGDSEQKGQLPKILLAVILFISAIGYSVYLMRPAPQAGATEVWYYDLGSKKLFSHIEQIPPIDAPSGKFEGGKGGVLAAVFSCGACDDESKRFIGWLVNGKPDSRKMVENHPVPPIITGVGARTDFLISMFPDAWEIKLPTDDIWIEYTSTDAEKVRLYAVSKCTKGAKAVACPGPASK